MKNMIDVTWNLLAEPISCCPASALLFTLLVIAVIAWLRR